MTKQNMQNVIDTVTKELISISSLLDEPNPDKQNLINKTNFIKNYFDSKTVEFRSTEDPQFLALQTALTNVDNIFEELLNEIKKA